MSRNRSAVVAGSTVTSLSFGAGGATAVLQSEMTSAIEGDPSMAISSVPAAAAAKRDGVMLSSRYLLAGRGAAASKDRTIAPFGLPDDAPPPLGYARRGLVGFNESWWPG
jgi:hypothetical protein